MLTGAGYAVPGMTADELERLLEIGDEEFVALKGPTAHRPFVHEKTLTVDSEALRSGWVENLQCHREFAETGALQIVFTPDNVRDIEILESYAIGRAWVEGSTVQLEQVRQDAAICFRSRNRVLDQGLDRDMYVVRAGPFFYRFLDGYFPMQVELRVDYPADKLQLWQVSPDRGVEVEHSAGEVTLSSIFKGTLRVEMWFVPI